MGETISNQRNKIWSITDRYFFIRPPEVREENQNYFVFLSIITALGFTAHLSYFFTFWIFGVAPLALFNIISIIAWFCAAVLNRKGHHLCSMVTCIIEVCLHQSLCVIVIGWGSGFQYYLLIIPVGIYLAPQKSTVLKSGLFALCYLNIALLDHFFRETTPLFALNPMMIAILNYGNIFFVVFVMSSVCYFFTTKVNDVETALRNEQSKVKKTLSLLSKYVAPQLLDTISDGQIDLIWKHNRKKLTLFFSDIKDLPWLPTRWNRKIWPPC